MNLADSQPSLDFDISGSMGGFTGSGIGSRLGKKAGAAVNSSKQSFKGEGHDDALSGSMDSRDFGLSGSYASMSRPGASSGAGFDPKTGVNFQGRDRAVT